MALSAFLSLEQEIESEEEREYWKGKGHMMADNVIKYLSMTTRPAHILSDLALERR